jgi:hypothetical protein
MRTAPVGLLVVAIGCTHAPQLVPAPNAARDPSIPGAATVQVAGVDVSVGGQSWSGSPSDLASLVTPLYVRLHNGSAVPIQLRYNLFWLSSHGLQAPAIPPFQIQRPGTAAIAVAPGFAADSFFLYPPYAGFYPGQPLWAGPWDYDPFYYEEMYGSWHPPLPTRDMLQQALPEGVLQPGGSAAGFLYFHHLNQPGPTTFFAQLVHAETRALVGVARIPMELRE